VHSLGKQRFYFYITTILVDFLMDGLYMYKFFLALGLSMAISVGSVSAAAQDKIGFVNSDRLLREAAPAQAAQQKLEAEFSKRGKELEDVAQRLKNQSDKLEKRRCSHARSRAR
jgi:outer membrane protein